MHGLTRTLRSLTKKLTALHPITKPKMKKKTYIYIYIYKTQMKTIAKEGQWVYRLRSLKPDGLSESDFFVGHNRGIRERGRK